MQYPQVSSWVKPSKLYGDALSSRSTAKEGVGDGPATGVAREHGSSTRASRVPKLNDGGRAVTEAIFDAPTFGRIS